MSEQKNTNQYDPLASLTSNERLKFLEALVTNVTSRSELFRQYSEKRIDVSKECNFPPTESISDKDYRDMYDRNPIAARVVDLLPLECWGKCPEVYEDEDSNTTTEFEQAIEDLPKGLMGENWFRGNDGNPIWETLQRADILSGIGSFGVILLGLDDGQPLDMPVPGVSPEGKKVGNVNHKLLFLRTFDESNVQISSYEQDPKNPRYGQPTQYMVTLNDPIDSSHTGIGLPTGTSMVHWTRVIHIADNLGSSELFGAPRQRPVWNNLLGLEKLYGGSPMMFWQGAFPGLSIETVPQLGADVVIDESAVKAQIENYMTSLQRYLALTGLTAKTLAPQIADPTAQIKVQLEAICVRIGVPMRIFLGSERGELSSSQDADAWAERLRNRRSNFCTPRIIVPFFNRLILVGALPTPKQFLVSWHDEEPMNPVDTATVAKSTTEAMAAYIAGNVEALIDPLDYLTRILGWEEEKAKAVLEKVIKHLADANPETEDPIVPGHIPSKPQPEQPRSPIKMKEGESLVAPDGTPLGKPNPKGNGKPVANVSRILGSDPATNTDLQAFLKTIEAEGVEFLGYVNCNGSEYLVNYNPSQPRDGSGKFSSGGGSGKSVGSTNPEMTPLAAQAVASSLEANKSSLSAAKSSGPKSREMVPRLTKAVRGSVDKVDGEGALANHQAIMDYHAKEASGLNSYADALNSKGKPISAASLSYSAKLHKEAASKHSDAIESWTVYMENDLTDNYSPNQPRDSHGRFGVGGKGSGKASKSAIAKASALRVDKEIQRYSEEHNEPQLASRVNGTALKDNEPVDVVTEIDGRTHGIELKTMTIGTNRKLTMKGDSQERKRKWERKNKGIVHTVVYDDSEVYNARGPGLHDTTKRRIFYRRGYGSFRVDGMLEVKDERDLRSLMAKTRNQLPKSAGGIR